MPERHDFISIYRIISNNLPAGIVSKWTSNIGMESSQIREKEPANEGIGKRPCAGGLITFARGTRGARLPGAMKYALRKLAASPGFMIVALVTLALGIGVNTTAFTVLNRLMLQALPYHDPASLVQLWSTSPRWGNIPKAPADDFDEREQSTVFTDSAAFSTASVSYAEVGKPPIQIGALYMTANFFTVLGVQPQLGRLPTEDESKHMAFVTLVSDSFWRTHFNGDPSVLGKLVRENSRTSTIIGVMPPSLNDPALFNSRPAFFYLD